MQQMGDGLLYLIVSNKKGQLWVPFIKMVVFIELIRYTAFFR